MALHLDPVGLATVAAEVAAANAGGRPAEEDQVADGPRAAPAAMTL